MDNYVRVALKNSFPYSFSIGNVKLPVTERQTFETFFCKTGRNMSAEKTPGSGNHYG